MRVFRRIKRCGAAFGKAERGSVSVEFVLAATLFFTAMMSLMELGLMTVGVSTLHTGVAEAGRKVRVGEAQCFDNDEIKKLICAEGVLLSKCVDRLKLVIKQYPSNLVGSPTLVSEIKDIPASQIGSVRATYSWHVLFPLVREVLGDEHGVAYLSRSFLFKTEEFKSKTCPKAS